MTNAFSFLPDALETLYATGGGGGLSACLQKYPELAQHRVLLLKLRSAEAALSDAEDAVQDAAHVMQFLEEELLGRLQVQGYNPPRLVTTHLPRRFTRHLSWNWIAWQLRRMLLLPNMTTPRPSRFTTSDCSSRSDG
jgi:hypothetical protein